MVLVAGNPATVTHKGSMRAAKHKPIALVFLVAISLAIASVPLEALSDMGGLTGDDQCCAPGEDPSSCAVEGTSGVPVDERCCPNGCEGCFLPCCAGPVSMCTSSIILGLNPGSIGSVTHYAESFSLTHPKKIYHPPRS